MCCLRYLSRMESKNKHNVMVIFSVSILLPWIATYTSACCWMFCKNIAITSGVCAQNLVVCRVILTISIKIVRHRKFYSSITISYGTIWDCSCSNITNTILVTFIYCNWSAIGWDNYYWMPKIRIWPCESDIRARRQWL